MSKRVFTFPAFIDFCKAKPPEEAYDYCNCTYCAAAQYANSLGMNWHDARDKFESFRAFDGLAAEEPRTFGALAERLEASPINVFKAFLTA